MKKIFYLFILVAFVACQEKAEQEVQQTEIEQTELSEQSIQETPKENKTGLTDYDKSKLVFQPAQVLPVNESKQNKTLRNFLDELLIVINNKNVEGLKPFIANDIKVSFGDDNGFDNFITFWDLDLNPEKSMLWDVLKTTITLGGTFNKENSNAYFTPYVFTNFPDEYDYFEFGTIIGEKVNIRSAPNLKAKLVRQLTHEVVRAIAYDKPFDSRSQKIGKETHDWMKIEMADGETGYVWGKFFRSAIDYRAGFATVRDEGWKMIFFVAGD